jgi:hypothetical protein
MNQTSVISLLNGKPANVGQTARQLTLGQIR